MRSFKTPLVLAGMALLAACAQDAPTAPRSLPPEAAFARGGQAGDPSAEMNRMLAAARAGTAQFHRVEVALQAGYVNTGECVSIPTGGMGIHFVNPALMGDASFDPSRPEVLLYEPRKNGGMRLVAAEFLIFSTPWEAAGNPGRPMFGSQPFYESFGPAAHGLPDHYELHLWIWRHNPNGMFAPFNPKVSCENA